MLAALVPAPLYNFARMRFILLDTGIRKDTNIIVNVKVEQWPGLSTSLVDDEIVECVMLRTV